MSTKAQTTSKVKEVLYTTTKLLRSKRKLVQTITYRDTNNRITNKTIVHNLLPE